MFMCMYTCTFTQVSTASYACKYTCLYIRICSYIYVCVCLCIFVYKHRSWPQTAHYAGCTAWHNMPLRIYVYTYMYLYIYTYVNTCEYTYIHICICSYIYVCVYVCLYISTGLDRKLRTMQDVLRDTICL